MRVVQGVPAPNQKKEYDSFRFGYYPLGQIQTILRLFNRWVVLQNLGIFCYLQMLNTNFRFIYVFIYSFIFGEGVILDYTITYAKKLHQSNSSDWAITIFRMEISLKYTQ